MDLGLELKSLRTTILGELERAAHSGNSKRVFDLSKALSEIERHQLTIEALENEIEGFSGVANGISPADVDPMVESVISLGVRGRQDGERPARRGKERAGELREAYAR